MPAKKSTPAKKVPANEALANESAPGEAPANKSGQVLPVALITGAGGQLGLELRDAVERARSEGRLTGVKFLFCTRAELDITDADAVWRFFSRNAVTHCFNCAAYTAVDGAEKDLKAAEAVNALGPQLLAEACAERDGLMVHVSTDFVFDGRAIKPYREDDPIQPLGVYGRTKAGGELRVLISNRRSIVVRTSWLYSAYGKNFVKTMLRLGRERQSLGVVADQHGSPTWARNLAETLLHVAFSGHLSADDYGVYHYANAGETTWHGLATEVMHLAGLRCMVQPIPTSEYPTPAARPAFSVLDSRKIRERFGVETPDWQDSLRDCVALLLQSEAA